MKTTLMYLGTLTLMAIHAYFIDRAGNFNLGVAGSFLLLHCTWFYIAGRWIEKSVKASR